MTSEPEAPQLDGDAPPEQPDGVVVDAHIGFWYGGSECQTWQPQILMS